jgi:hypothetical protein
MRPAYFVGLDLGRRHDFTALVVVEARPGPATLRVRYVERIPLGTEYVGVVERVRRVVESPALRGQRNLIVDATGLGGPVVELLRRARMDCRMWPVSITGAAAQGYRQGLYRVPKRDLVVGLQRLFQQGLVQIAEGVKDGDALMKELRDMRVKVSRAGREQYEAGKCGQHDDLVLALSLACWPARRAAA